MKAVGTVKQEHIMEAAIKRFSHFGVNKTTLGEIADDLAISKPALFYYFNDKNSLVNAVSKKIVNEFVGEVEAELSIADSVEEGLLLFVDVKRRFYKKYFLLAMQAETLDANKISKETFETIENSQRETAGLLAQLLQSGIEQKTVRPLDAMATGTLLINTLKAFEVCSRKKSSVPDNEEIDALFDKQKEVIKLFVHGLKQMDEKTGNKHD